MQYNYVVSDNLDWVSSLMHDTLSDNYDYENFKTNCYLFFIKRHVGDIADFVGMCHLPLAYADLLNNILTKKFPYVRMIKPYQLIGNEYACDTMAIAQKMYSAYKSCKTLDR